MKDTALSISYKKVDSLTDTTMYGKSTAIRAKDDGKIDRLITIPVTIDPIIVESGYLSNANITAKELD